MEGDIKEAGTLFKPASFDVITSNPPYMTGSHGLVNPDMEKAIARHEICCTLEDVISQAARLLRVGGRFYLVHRPFRLAEIIHMLVEYKLEPKRIKFVHPFVDKETEYGFDRVCQRGEVENYSGKAFDCISEARCVYRRNL